MDAVVVAARVQEDSEFAKQSSESFAHDAAQKKADKNKQDDTCQRVLVSHAHEYRKLVVNGLWSIVNGLWLLVVGGRSVVVVVEACFGCFGANARPMWGKNEKTATKRMKIIHLVA